MHEPAQDAEVVVEAREAQARLTQLDALALDPSDAEAPADERVEVDAAGQDVAPRLGVRELDAGLLAQRVQRLGGDEGDRVAGLGAPRGEVVLALQAAAGVRAHPLHGARELAALRGERDGDDLAALRHQYSAAARRRRVSRASGCSTPSSSSTETTTWRMSSLRPSALGSASMSRSIARSWSPASRAANASA